MTTPEECIANGEAVLRTATQNVQDIAKTMNKFTTQPGGAPIAEVIAVARAQIAMADAWVALGVAKREGSR